MLHTKVIRKKPLIEIDDLTTHERKHLMRKLLILVIVINLIVLLSLILFT